MRQISFKELATSLPTKIHAFELRLYSFSMEAADIAVEGFKESFDKKQLNASSAPKWKPTKRRNPILDETGSLKNSISKRPTGRFSSEVFSDGAKLARGKNGRTFYYAAVHNAPSGTFTYGRSGVPSVQRQFVGDSDIVARRIERKLESIFRVLE